MFQAATNAQGNPTAKVAVAPRGAVVAAQPWPLNERFVSVHQHVTFHPGSDAGGFQFIGFRRCNAPH